MCWLYLVPGTVGGFVAELKRDRENVVTERGGAGKITQTHQASHQTKEETWRLAGTSMPGARTGTSSFFLHYTECTLGGLGIPESRLEEWAALGQVVGSP